ncbi:MAG TPA: hypothetical protein PLU52_05095 [Opitutaceae bacterium]|nr:hypothetical protein [Opitutaceae bacterium]
MKLDFGCGPNPHEGYTGVDQYPFDGKVGIVGDITDPHFWDQFEDESVEAAHASHFLEHLTAPQRILFMNQVHRILKPKAQITIIVPHWAAARAYGDPTHQWPPVSEWFFLYLNREWRKVNAPHTDGEIAPGMYLCDFDGGLNYNPHPELATRNPEFGQFAVSFYKEACQDIVATLTKR